MNTAPFGLAWAAVLLGAGYRYRPFPRRVPTHPPHPEHQAYRTGTPGAPGRRWVPVEALGRCLLRLSRRLRAGYGNGGTRRPPPSLPPDPARARWVGLVAVAGVTTGALVPVLLPAVVFGAWAWPRLQARRQERRRLVRIEAGLPEAVDLLVLAVGAGATVSHAVAAAGRRGTGPLAAELRRITEEVHRGGRVADALDELPARAGEVVRPLAAALASCERYGAPLGPALERLGDDVRRQRQRRAEEAARKVPVLLLFPLVLCILPAFALLTVAPLVAGALRTLRL